MIEVQVINKVLAGDKTLIDNYGVDSSYFKLYNEEFEFLINHMNKYGNIPDSATFFDKFTEFPRVEVTESNSYLMDMLNDEVLYNRSVEVLRKVEDLLKVSSNEAVQYLASQLPGLSTTAGNTPAIDIIQDFDSRYEKIQKKLTAQSVTTITTGFPELDDIVQGWSLGEELVVLFARTGQGKSWVLEKMLIHAWELGYRVGCISPEMSAEKYGFRFDTLFGGYSHKRLTWGREIDLEAYKAFGEELKRHKNPFLVPTPKDFQNRMTVSKIRQFCKSNKLDILGVDGISYLADERSNKYGNKTTALTNISEDLMAMSLELQIPIIVVVQANRNGVKGEEEDGTPELEHIRDSDGISHNATKIIAIRQKNDTLEMSVKKNRDGAVGATIVYDWDVDIGKFDFSTGGQQHRQELQKQRQVEKKKGVDCF